MSEIECMICIPGLSSLEKAKKYVLVDIEISINNIT